MDENVVDLTSGTEALADCLKLRDATLSENRGVEVRDGHVFATKRDPRLEIAPVRATRYFAIDIRYEEGYSGDMFRIYYMFEEGDYFSEAKTIDLSSEEGFFSKVLEFSQPVSALRIDPCENTDETGIRSIFVAACDGVDDAYNALFGASGSLGPTEGKREKFIVCMHELSNTGAPILAFNIAKRMRDAGIEVLVMTASHGDGDMAKRCFDEGIAICDLKSFAKPGQICEVFSTEIMPGLLQLHQAGYKVGYLNSLVAAQYAIYFKAAGFRTISLIHETGESIEAASLHSMASSTAKFSDVMVFPSPSVESDYRRLADGIPGESFVRSQGVYLAGQDSSSEEMKQLACLLDDMGIAEESRIVISVGSINIRKGFDLFIAAATEVQKMVGEDKDVHFVWVGDTLTKRDEDEYAKRLEFQAKKCGAKIHRLRYLQPSLYRLLLKSSDVFWSTSRDDTFPSVILDAMYFSVPSVAFKGSGGADVMLADGRGYLAERFAPSNFAEITQFVLDNADAAKEATERGRKWISDRLDFGDYVEFLISLSSSDERVAVVDARNALTQDYSSLKSTAMAVDSGPLRISLGKLGKFAKHSRHKAKHGQNAEGAPLVSFASTQWARRNKVFVDECLGRFSEMFGRAGDVISACSLMGPNARWSKQLKFACGDDLLRSDYSYDDEWAFPSDLSVLSNTCLVGAGMDTTEPPDVIGELSAELFRFLFDKRYMHSVRDSYTQDKLKSIGIENTIVTGSPSVWGMGNADLERIPRSKAKEVVTVVNSYHYDHRKDVQMLKILSDKYEKVHVWLQGRRDYEVFFSRFVNAMSFEFLEPTLRGLDIALSSPDVEYVGAGFDVGCRALSHGRRAIFAMPNVQSKAICDDVRLPCVEEGDKEGLEALIESDLEMSVAVPVEAIAEWRSQFS